MRLTEHEITKIVQKLFRTWKFDKLMEPRVSDGELLMCMEDIIKTNLREEEALNKEVQAMVDKLIDQTDEEIDQRKMFQLIKNQLVKERKMVI